MGSVESRGVVVESSRVGVIRSSVQGPGRVSWGRFWGSEKGLGGRVRRCGASGHGRCFCYSPLTLTSVQARPGQSQEEKLTLYA